MRHGDTRSCRGAHPAPHSRSPEARPRPSPTSRGSAGPQPGADPVEPGRLGTAAALLGLLLRLTAARAPRQPPAPPRYVTASPCLGGGGRGTSRGCRYSPAPGAAGQLGGPRGPHNAGGSHAYRGEQLRSGDGGAVAVQFDATSQVKVADLHWGDLGRGGKEWSVTPPASSRNQSWQPPGDHKRVFTPRLLNARLCHASQNHTVLWHMGCVCVPGRTWGVGVCVPGRTLLHRHLRNRPTVPTPPGSTPCTHPGCSPLTWSGLSHRIFSGFRSLCAIPGGKRANEGKNPPPTRLL